MMYPLVTLDDNTEIVYSDVLVDGKVKVYIEKPDPKDCFHCLTCFLPLYEVEGVYGFNEEEVNKYLDIIKSTEHLITIPRKLEKQEHIKTRKLWEEVFQEDTKEFLDYYYSVKTLENEIYVIEEDNKIVSMLHLNPYQMRIGDKIFKTHYIVAVATDEHYRKRGYMAKLLNYTVQIMQDRGEPFTFLMPAAEAIYKPFGFEFVYEQKRGTITGKAYEGSDLTFAMAEEKDCQETADFANEFLREYDVVTWRDASYYETLLAEQSSENGGILLAKKEQKIVGVFCFAKSEVQGEHNAKSESEGEHNTKSEVLVAQNKIEKRIEIREPLFKQKSILQHAVYHLTGTETEEVFCTGYGSETKPMIMAKVLKPDFEKDLKNCKVFLNEVV